MRFPMNEKERREFLGDTIKMINYTLQEFENKREKGGRKGGNGEKRRIQDKQTDVLLCPD